MYLFQQLGHFIFITMWLCHKAKFRKSFPSFSQYENVIIQQQKKDLLQTSTFSPTTKLQNKHENIHKFLYTNIAHQKVNIEVIKFSIQIRQLTSVSFYQLLNLVF